MSNEPDKWLSITDRAERYKANCVHFSQQHYRAADRAYRRHQLLGIPIVIISTILTTSIFATLNTTPRLSWKIAAGLVSLVAAVLAALQAFLKFHEKGSDHKAAAAAYRGLGRNLDIFLLKYRGTASAPGDQAAFAAALEHLERLADGISDLATSSPHIGARIPETQSTTGIP